MRFGDEPESSNFDGRHRPRRRWAWWRRLGGAGLAACSRWLPAASALAASIVLVIGYFLLSSLGGLGGGEAGGLVPSQQQARRRGQARSIPTRKHFTLQVLASTEDTLDKLLRRDRYTPTTLRLLFGGRSVGLRRRHSRPWAPSTARPTRRSISTPSSSTSFRSASRRPATSPWPMSSRMRSAITSRT